MVSNESSFRTFLGAGDSDDGELYLSEAYIYSQRSRNWLILDDPIPVGRESPACGIIYDRNT